jgi:hypothetical protein
MTTDFGAYRALTLRAEPCFASQRFAFRSRLKPLLLRASHFDLVNPLSPATQPSAGSTDAITPSLDRGAVVRVRLIGRGDVVGRNRLGLDSRLKIIRRRRDGARGRATACKREHG